MLFALHFVLRLAPFYLVFCTKTHCILHQNTLHFAPKHTAFCTKTHCVLHHIALHLAPNSPKMGANGGSL